MLYLSVATKVAMSCAVFTEFTLQCLLDLAFSLNDFSKKNAIKLQPIYRSDVTLFLSSFESHFLLI